MDNDIDFYSALRRAADIPGVGRAESKIRPFVLFIQGLKAKAEILSVSQLLEEIIEQTGYVEELRAEGTDEAEARIENINELISKTVAYEESTDEPSLSGFLEEVALVADIDDVDSESDYLSLIHI